MKNNKVNLALVLLSAIAIGIAFAIKGRVGNYYVIPIIVAVVFLLIALYGFLFSKKATPETPEFFTASYKKKKALLSKPEIQLYDMLLDSFGKKYEILPQVALASIIDKVTENSFRNELFRVVDFCIVDRNTFEPIVIVELNDASHNRSDRKERDLKVNELCEKAGLKVATIDLKDISDTGKIRKIIKDCL